MGHTASAASSRVLFLGDSLTTGAGIGSEHAFPALIGQQLKNEGHRVEIINAGVNGSTTDSAFDRLNSALQYKPDILVLALGANDGLRGYPVGQIKRNLEKTLDLAKSQNVRTLLIGMKTLAFHGQGYAVRFDALFSDLAKNRNVPFIPFLLEGVALRRDLNLPDGFHPNDKGQRIIAATVIAPLRQILDAFKPKNVIYL